MCIRDRATDRSTVARCVVRSPAARPCARPRGLYAGRFGLGAVRQAEPGAHGLHRNGLVVAPFDQADAGAPACVALALVELAAGGQPGLAAPVRQPKVVLLALALDRDLERRDDDVERLAAAQPGWARLADDLDAGQRHLDAAHEMELADPPLPACREAHLGSVARLHLGEEVGRVAPVSDADQW